MDQQFVNSDQTRLCSQHFVGKEGPTKTNPLPSIFPKPDGNDKGLTIIRSGESQSISHLKDQGRWFHDYGGCITSCGGIAHKAEQIEPVMISVSTQTDEISDEKHVAFTQTISSETCSVGIQVNKPDLTFEDIENNDEKLMIIPEFSEKLKTSKLSLCLVAGGELYIYNAIAIIFPFLCKISLLSLHRRNRFSSGSRAVVVVQVQLVLKYLQSESEFNANRDGEKDNIKMPYKAHLEVLNQILGLPPDLLDSYEVIICR
ncbi:hypothetical protein KUTeg_011591 [Tegillarca granosa]|uniref:THAP-type domain-containing protein n=1 Tax=Tegillarca granosa TaxID=220873 RepID=A0ABQ9EX21_TEGGR|nr:hypothetical protein KUTeg_011591 [Tegillarca granosa]